MTINSDPGFLHYCAWKIPFAHCSQCSQCLCLRRRLVEFAQTVCRRTVSTFLPLNLKCTTAAALLYSGCAAFPLHSERAHGKLRCWAGSNNPTSHQPTPPSSAAAYVCTCNHIILLLHIVLQCVQCNECLKTLC